MDKEPLYYGKYVYYCQCGFDYATSKLLLFQIPCCPVCGREMAVKKIIWTEEEENDRNKH